MKKVATKKVKKSEEIVYPVCPFCKETMWPGVAYYRDDNFGDNNIYAWQCDCSDWPKKIKKEWGIE
jgi:hypothetical protein